jgi:hypothetical protein
VAEGSSRTADRERGPLRRLAELLALTAFAFAQPVLDVTGRSPDFFLYRRPSIWQIRLLVLAIVLGPPLGLWLAEQVVGLVRPAAARALHLVFLAVLFAVLAIEVGKHVGAFHGVPLAAVAAVAGVVFAVLAARSVGLRQAMMYAAPAPALFALLFVMTSPAGALVRVGHTSKIAAIPPGSPEKRPPIVFLFLDEFPLRALLTADGKIDATLFPNFARLQQKTSWYPNATGVSGWTPFAAPAMLNGRYPEKVLAPSYLAYPQNMFTLLGGTYKVNAYETIAELCPPSLCAGTAISRPTGLYAMAHDTAHIARQIVSPNPAKTDPTQQFAETATIETKPITDRKKLPSEMFRFDQADKNQPDRLTSFLKGLVPSDKPQLHFLHLLLPHAPWKYLPSNNTYDAAPATYVPRRPGESEKDVSLDPVLTVLAKQRTLLQLVYTDHLIGTLLDRLEATGLYDKALLIVTADHGNGLTPGSRARVRDDHNDPNLTWVPLFVKTPGQKAGKVDLRNEQQVDLLPTIADVLDVDIPWRVDGQSVLGPPRTTSEKPWYDIPGEREQVDLTQAATGHIGYASEIARPELGVEGLYGIGPYKGLVGRKVADLTVGAPSPVHATLAPKIDLRHVDPATGHVPAMLWGRLDGALGTASTYVVASVNGTVAGTLPAVLDGEGGWRFLGIVDDKYLTKGSADVTLYAVDGTTLHPIAWR